MSRHFSNLLLVVSLIIGTCITPCCADLHSKDKENKIMNTESLFILLTTTKGSVYQGYRDQWLADKAASRAFLSGKRPIDAAWESRIQEKILLGWDKNGDLYSSVLKKIDGIDVAFQLKTVSGMAGVYGEYYRRAKSEYLDPILPLCWEACLKFDGHWPDWKVMIFLHMLRALPNELSVDPVFHVLTTSDNIEVRETAAKVLTALPPSLVKARLPALTEKHQSITDLLTRLGEE